MNNKKIYRIVVMLLIVTLLPLGNVSVFAKTKKSSKKDVVYSSVEIYDKCMPCIVHISANGIDGSGFFIEPNKILTNYHVAKDFYRPKILDINNNRYYPKSILGYDEKLDLVIVETYESSSNVLPISNREFVPGEVVYALGNPINIPFVITQGLVGNSGWTNNGRKTILHSAPVSPGNSGGPLVNSYGEVIGINTCSFDGGGVQNLNEALMMEEVSKLDLSNPLTIDQYNDRVYVESVDCVSTRLAQPGDYIKLGKYDQDNNEMNGKEDIEWLVLTNDTKDNIFVVSRYCLDVMQWTSNKSDNKWKTSQCRNWLNDEFFKTAFNEKERESILFTDTSRDISKCYLENNKKKSLDNIFLLSEEENNLLFAGFSSLSAVTETCRAKGAFARDNGLGCWATRTSSPVNKDIYGQFICLAQRNNGAIHASIDVNAIFNPNDQDKIEGKVSIRPAMWIMREE